MDEKGKDDSILDDGSSKNTKKKNAKPKKVNIPREEQERFAKEAKNAKASSLIATFRSMQTNANSGNANANIEVANANSNNANANIEVTNANQTANAESRKTRSRNEKSNSRSNESESKKTEESQLTEAEKNALADFTFWNCMENKNGDFIPLMPPDFESEDGLTIDIITTLSDDELLNSLISELSKKIDEVMQRKANQFPVENPMPVPEDSMDAEREKKPEEVEQRELEDTMHIDEPIIPKFK